MINRLFMLFNYFILMSSYAYADEWKTIDHYQVKDGLAKDLNTGLMWMRCSIGQNWYGLLGYGVCQGEAKIFSSENETHGISSNFEYSGYADWRIPSVDELVTLFNCDNVEGGLACGDNKKKSPYVVQLVFPQTSEQPYLSSNSKYFNESYESSVFFSYLSPITAPVGWRAKGFAMRPVRGESNLAKPVISDISVAHDSGIVNNQIDYGVTVYFSIQNMGKTGPIPIKVYLSCSEGGWVRQQKIILSSGEKRSLKFFFSEPSVNASNISYQIDTK